MTFKQLKSRRDFLALGARTISTIGAAAAFGQAGLISAKAQSTEDYKALVCIFLFGGNDCNNLLIPNDKADLRELPDHPPEPGHCAGFADRNHDPVSGANYGLHPSLSPLGLAL